MTTPVFENKKFDKIDYSATPFVTAEYDYCTFTDCIFSDIELFSTIFTECTFINCNFSMTKTNHTSFRDAVFKGCKLMGVHFSDCNTFLFSVSFEHCQLDLASFYKLKLKNTVFKQCSLKEVDFAEADLSNAIFADCEMLGATFGKTILEKADFRTAYNYVLDPESNRIKKAKFSLAGISGLLEKYSIHIEK